MTFWIIAGAYAGGVVTGAVAVGLAIGIDWARWFNREHSLRDAVWASRGDRLLALCGYYTAADLAGIRDEMAQRWLEERR